MTPEEWVRLFWLVLFMVLILIIIGVFMGVLVWLQDKIVGWLSPKERR